MHRGLRRCISMFIVRLNFFCCQYWLFITKYQICSLYHGAFWEFSFAEYNFVITVNFCKRKALAVSFFLIFNILWIAQHYKATCVNCNFRGNLTLRKIYWKEKKAKRDMIAAVIEILEVFGEEFKVPWGLGVGIVPLMRGSRKREIWHVLWCQV